MIVYFPYLISFWAHVDIPLSYIENYFEYDRNAKLNLSFEK